MFAARRARSLLSTAAVAAMTVTCLVGTAQAASASTPSQCDAVAGNLVKNCGFEAAAADWTVTNPQGHTGPIGSPPAAHSGSNNWGMCDPTDSELSQQIDGTVPQAVYRVSFYLANNYPTPRYGPEDFSAEIDGTYDGDRTFVTDTKADDQFDWVLESYDFRAGATAPTLKFTAAQYGACWYLDDVVVVPLDTPSQCDAVAGNLVQNCGFEADPAYTADPTGWSFTPAQGGHTDAGNDKAGFYVHSGDHYYGFGATADTGLPADDDTISQQIQGTTDGATYRLTFEFQNLFPSPSDEAGQGPDFSATITGTKNGTVTVLSGHHKNHFEYTEFGANFAAGPTPPTISFSGAKLSGFFDLDDVVVVPVTVPLPKVTSVSPSSGPTTGGTSVTLTGSDFTGATQVTFGASGTPRPFTVDSDTQITVVSPAHAAGQQNVFVTTLGGTSAAKTANRFTYIPPPPKVTGVSPGSGSTAGGTSITVTGKYFTGATGVMFGSGGTPVTPTVSSDTQLTVTAPAHSAGPLNLFVITPSGTSDAVAADHYTYVAPPVVTAVSPGTGPTSGGTSITVTGRNFTGATAVRFGSTGSPVAVTPASDTSIVLTTPAHSAGQLNIFVISPGGTSAAVGADRFTYTSG